MSDACLEKLLELVESMALMKRDVEVIQGKVAYLLDTAKTKPVPKTYAANEKTAENAARQASIDKNREDSKMESHKEKKRRLAKKYGSECSG